MHEDIEQRVIEIIARKKGLPAGSLTAETAFAEIGVDSLDAIDLIFSFEDTFTVIIPDEVAQQIKTVGQATAVLREAVSHGSSGAG